MGFNLFKYLNLFDRFRDKDHIIIITNEKLYSLHYQEVKKNILKTTSKIDEVIIPDGEQNKSLKTAVRVFEFLKKNKYSKSIVLVALGGGVIGDLTGFISSIYLRGTHFVQIPTSLLSQIDSSMGGKNAINYEDAKNMIGSFYHPDLVIINLDFLETLPIRHFRSGMAEAIKYGIAMNYDFFCWIEDNYEKISLLDEESIRHLVLLCCKMKCEVVVQDPKEYRNKRVLLNLGHTFAHSIESFSKFNESLYHGEAVSIGMVISLKIANIVNRFSERDIFRVISLLKRFDLPLSYQRHIPFEDYLYFMNYDKKRTGQDQINLVLPLKIGTSILYRNIDKEIIYHAIY
ncbi:3-dehydroquinate synthase [Candidatus Riesia pediculischaeffi]|uniref:3-dehydroquinate synthase n=1 Tax=Candidatus Riesia pediculischaeffi TaxID=428411 RepID=UPI0005AC70E8|nr:3-dehydroquinate synthase [Candidatus Riesia pediculischaeffi]